MKKSFFRISSILATMLLVSSCSSPSCCLSPLHPEETTYSQSLVGSSFELKVNDSDFDIKYNLIEGRSVPLLRFTEDDGNYYVSGNSYCNSYEALIEFSSVEYIVRDVKKVGSECNIENSKDFIFKLLSNSVSYVHTSGGIVFELDGYELFFKERI